MKLHPVFVLTVFGGLTACGEGPVPSSVNSGNMSITMEALTSQAAITRVTIDVQPANIQQEIALTGSTGQITETLLIPTGEQTIAVEAFSDNAKVGEGSAKATVVAGQKTDVLITIYDTTPGISINDRGPIITYVVVPKSVTDVNESITLSARAVDLDDDAVALAWTDNCGGSTFGTPDGASTMWTNTAEGVCHINITATSGGKSHSRSFIVSTTQATGSAEIAAVFIPKPKPVRFELRSATGGMNGTEYVCDLDSTGSGHHGTCTQTLMAGSNGVTTFTVDIGMPNDSPHIALGFSATLYCEGARPKSGHGNVVKAPAPSRFVSWTLPWQAPAFVGNGVACSFEFRVRNRGLEATYAAGLVVKDSRPEGTVASIRTQADVDRLREYRVLEQIHLREDSTVTSLDLPHLEEVRGEISLTNNRTLETVSMPALRTANDVFVYKNPVLSSISMPRLESIKKGALQIGENPALGSLGLGDSLKSVAAHVSITDNPELCVPNLNWQQIAGPQSSVIKRNGQCP